MKIRQKARCVITLLLILTLAVSIAPATACAAPKTMPGGITFDAAFYGAMYPDVVKVFGTDENALFQHYVTYGIKEGRLPVATGAQAAAPAPVVNPVSTAAPVSAPKAFLKRWKGRSVSILGDSISTFGGNHPADYIPFFPQSYMPTSDLTWWMQTIRAGSMGYVANASWSGSRVSGNSQDESGKTGCSVKRTRDLSTAAAAPNLIFVMMGANDFFSSVQPGSYVSRAAAQASGNGSFAGAYNTMLNNLQALHPGAQIVCLTCIPAICTSTGTPMLNDLGLNINDYNTIIRAAAADHGVLLCDTYACGITTENWKTYLGDGIHPTAQGMALIATYIVNHM